MGFAGQVSPLFSINNLILFMRGPDDGQMRVALREGSGIRLQPFRERLRKALPEKVKPWLADLLQKQGLTQESARARAEQVIFGFEPGDMVSEVMSFGSPAPIEVVVASPNLADTRAHAQRIMAEMKKIPSLRDVQVPAGTGLPDGARGDRPRARRLERRDRPAGGQRRGGELPPRAVTSPATSGSMPRTATATRSRSRSPRRR